MKKRRRKSLEGKKSSPRRGTRTAAKRRYGSLKSQKLMIKKMHLYTPDTQTKITGRPLHPQQVVKIHETLTVPIFYFIMITFNDFSVLNWKYPQVLISKIWST